MSVLTLRSEPSNLNIPWTVSAFRCLSSSIMEVSGNGIRPWKSSGDIVQKWVELAGFIAFIYGFYNDDTIFTILMKVGCLETFRAKPWASDMRELTGNLNLNNIVKKGNSFSLSFEGGNCCELSKLENSVLHLKFQCPTKHFDVSNEDSIILQSMLSHLSDGNLNDSKTEIDYDSLTVIVTYSPFSITITSKTDGTKIIFNAKNKTCIEKHSFDVTFSDSHVIGLPARDSVIFLEPTIINSAIISDPYRIFNCDTGEFRPPKTFSVYGAINFLQCSNSALFVANASDTFVDLVKEGDSLTSHFISQSGPIDLFFFLGSRKTTTTNFTKLTGPSFFPSMTDFGFNHCKWGMKTQEEVEAVIETYERAGVPFDKMWLDIDHLIEQRPFTVNKETFPNIDKLKQDLAMRGRSLAIIQDPHLPFEKNHEQAEDCLKLGFAVKQGNGQTFVGWCWPGNSIYPDFISPDVRKWWGDLVPLDVSLWNDMNEPSVFNDADENTMPMDNLHYQNLPHSSVHNVYGHFHCLASANGVTSRSNLRPFVLTRSYFAGTHRHAAVWTGDAVSSYESLRISVHQMCTASACGMSYIGADIGGFFGSPLPEFLEQWFANAVWFYPFLRMHCHIDSTERHGVVADSAAIKAHLMCRYEMIPYWYTTFYLNHTQLESVIRFAWFDYPDVGFENEQVLIGRNLMALPVTAPNASTLEIQCPADTEWVNFYTFKKLESRESVVYDGNIPVFVRMGTITPLFQNPTTSVAETRKQPLRLLVVCDSTRQANGMVYLDDGRTRDYQRGAYLLSELTFENNSLRNEPIHSGYSDNTVVSVVSVIHDGVKTDIKVTLELSQRWEHRFSS